MTRVAIVLNLAIVALGMIGIAAPYTMMEVTRPLETPYGAAAARVILGGALVFAAPTSRAPRVLRVLGFAELVAGLATPFLGVEFDLALRDWWVAQGPGFIRILAVVTVAIGSGFIFLLWPRRERRTHLIE